MDNLERDLIAQGLTLRETHISWVFLGEERVYKIKKPVELGFLDFRTLERRQHFCEVEVALNRRLAPDVYLGVVPVTRDAAGTHRLGGNGVPVDYAVEMRRMPDADTADVRLREGRLSHDDLARIAQRIADFHAHARCDAETARLGLPSAIETNVRENFEQTRDTAPALLAREELAAIERWQLAFLRDHQELFERRIHAGHVRDGHGDLRLEHCYVSSTGEIAILDCIEFNERFRYADVCADIAFLAMDLNWHDRRDLSEALLADYARATNDYDLYAVVDFYQSYRAYVRGKVNSFLVGQSASDVTRAHAAEQARKFFLLAAACTKPPLDPPRLIAVGGVIASGKSSLASALARAWDCPALEADRQRKLAAGVQPLAPLSDQPFSGQYAPAQTQAVYAELLRCAEVVLRSGRSVIVDASFRSREHRLAAQELARRMNVPFWFVECQAPRELCRARLAERAKRPAVSDGRLEIFDSFADSYEAVDELRSSEHIRVDTREVLSDNVARVLEQLIA